MGGIARGNRKRHRLPFSLLPISPASIFHAHPSLLRDDWVQVSVRALCYSDRVERLNTTGLSADDDLHGLTETNPSS